MADNNDPQSLESRLNAVVAPIDQPPVDATQQKLNEVAAPATDDHLAERLKAVSAPVEQAPTEQATTNQIRSAAMGVGGEFALPYLAKSDPENLSEEEKQAIVNLDGKSLSNLLKANKGIKLSDVSTKDLVPMYRKLQDYEDHSPEAETHPIVNAAKGVANDIVDGLHGVKTFASDLGNALYLQEPAEGESQTPESQRLKEVYKDFFSIGDKIVGAVKDLHQLGSKINEGGMKLADDLGIGIHPTSGILTIQHKTPTEKLINRITRDEIDANRERVKAKVPSNIGQVLYYAGEKPTDSGQQSYAQLLRPILASYLVPSVKQRMLDNPNLTEGEATQQFIQDSDKWGSSALQEYAKELPKPKKDVGTAAEFLLPQYTTTFGIGAESLGGLIKGVKEGARLSEVEQLMPQAQAITDTAQTAREGGTFYVDPQGNVHVAPKSSTGPRTKEQLREDWNNAEQLHTDNLKTIASDRYERSGGNAIRLGPWNIPKPFVWAGAGSNAANNTADAIKKAATTGALATALPVTTGAIGAYQNRNQGLLGMGAGFLKGVEYGAAGELAGYGALKTAGKSLGVLSDIGKVRSRLKGTGGNVFQIAGNLPTSTDLTKEIFGGKVGKITAPVANWMANNLVNWGYEGVQAGVLAGAMGVLDSTPYQDLPEQIASGAAMMMMPHILTSAIHETPASREKRIQEENNRINQVKAQASPESIKTASQFSDYREVVNNQRQIADDKVQKLRETLANPKAKPEEIKQATQEAKEADQKLTQVMSANSETRLEYGRQNDLLWSNIHRGLNGPLLAGQGNIGLEILTKDQILQKLVDQNKELASTPQGMAKLEMIAGQDGMVINSAGGVELRAGTDLAEALKNDPIMFDPSKTTAIINADNARTRAGVYGTTTYDALSHEGGHLYARTKEFQAANSELLSQLFSTNIFHDDGTIATEETGAVSNDQLKDMIWNNYLEGRTDEQKKAWLASKGMWDLKNDRFIDKEVLPYAREEYIAEMAGNSLHQMTSRGGETAVMKWARTSASNNTLARAIQAVLGHGGPDPTKPSPVMGIEFTPEIAAATEKAIQAVHDYNGHIAPVIDAQPVVEITQQELKKNKGLRKKYGIQSGMFQTQVFATIRDAKGNVVSKVVIPSEATPEGSWKIDPKTGKPVQTKGYGQIPDEVNNVQIPEGGSLDVKREVAMQPDGESPIMLSDSQIKKNQKVRRDLILNALGITGEIPEQGITWRGTFTPEQIQNIKNLPENVVPKTIKDVILSMNETLASGEGKRWLAEYSPTSGKKGKRKSLMMKQYDVVPIGMHFTKDGNFNVTVISATRLFNKIHAWGAEFPHILDMWGGDKSAFFNDFVTKYLANWQAGREGWEGLDPDEKTAKFKRDVFDNFLNLKDKDTEHLNQNRFYLEGKMADLDRTIMSMRADHMSSLQPSSAQPIPVDYYKAKINAMPESGLPYQERPEEGEIAPRVEEERRPTAIDLGITAAHSKEEKPFGIRYASPQREGETKDDYVNRIMAARENPYNQDTAFTPLAGSQYDYMEGSRKAAGSDIAFMPASAEEKYPTSERGFYSGLQKTIDEKMPEKASPQQILSIVNNPQNAKPEEVKWSNLSGFLDGKESVTKQEVLDYLKNEGSVKFEERTLGDKNQKWVYRGLDGDLKVFNSKKEAQEAYQADKDWADSDAKGKVVINDNDAYWTDENGNESGHYTYDQDGTWSEDDGYWEGNTQQLRLRLENHANAQSKFYQDQLTEPAISEKGSALYADFTLPNGDNYREVVLTMPNKSKGDPIKSSKKLTDGSFDVIFTNGEKGNYPSLEKARVDGAGTSEIKGVDKYWSSHFSDIPNYVAHMRLDERKDSTGKDGLFIQEYQSDRHQAGREKGYQSDPEVLEKAQSELNAAESALQSLQKLSATTPLDTPMGEKLPEKMAQAQVRYQEALQKVNSLSGQVPDAPFRKDWSVQMFKRALRDAIASGKEWIGWTNGETQAERYDLSKQVDALMYVKRDDGTYRVDFIPKGRNGEWSNLGNNLKESDLADNIGKEIAEKIVRGEGEPNTFNGTTILRGVDLKVGGEGMKGFYDQILPKEIGKYVKKWGAKVEEGYVKTDPNEYDTTPIWKVEITPEMRESIQKGGQLSFMPSRDEEPERITEAAYTNPRTGEVSRGATHTIANPNAPQEATDRESPAYGFATDKGRIVDRKEGYQIAQAAGQLKEPATEEEKFHDDRGVLHSGMYEPSDASDVRFMPKSEDNNEKYDASIHDGGINAFKEKLKSFVYSLPDPSEENYDFHIEKDSAFSLVENYFKDAFDNLGASYDEHGGGIKSKYIHISIPTGEGETLENTLEQDRENHKITIRDHDVSVFRAREFGFPTKVIQVDNFDTKENVLEAATDLFDHLAKILEPYRDYLAEKAKAEGQLKEPATLDEKVDNIRGVLHSDMVNYGGKSKGEISFMPSSKLDEAHAKAIESGDTEEAQRLVDEAARKAGYKTDRLYHGTIGDINIPSGDLGVAAHLSRKKEIAQGYADARFRTDENARSPEEQEIPSKVHEWYVKGEIFHPLNDLDLDRVNQGSIYLDKSEWNHADYTFFERPEVQEAIKNAGFAGYEDREGMGHSWGENLAVFDPNNIKSADPATYDDQGNLIPLSQRFDTSKQDIRFMPKSEEPENFEKVKKQIPDLLPISKQPENLPVIGRLSAGQQQAIDELDKYYSDKTPERIKVLKKDAEESLSSRLTNLGIPVADSKRIASNAFSELKKSVKGAMQVISGMGLSDLSRMAGSGRPSVETREKINPAWLTSAFESFATDDALALMKAQQVARQLNKSDQAKVAAGEEIEAAKASGVRQSTIEQGMNFVVGERTADQKAFGSSLREDMDAPPRVYASVVEGQKYGSQGNYNLFFEWDKSTPMVITSHHHYGVGNGLTDIHASANIGDKNARSFGDPSNEKYDTLPSGKKVLNTHLLVGNDGAPDIRAHQLMVSIPKSGLDDVKREFKKSGVKAAEAEMQKIIASQLVGTPSQGKTQAFTTDEGIPPYVAVQKNRTEAYVLNPDLKNVKKITIVSNKPKEVELIKKNLQRAFENNGTEVPKIEIVSKESGPSQNTGRKAITDKFFKLTGKLAFMPEGQTQATEPIDWSVFTQKTEKPLSTIRAYAVPQQQKDETY